MAENVGSEWRTNPVNNLGFWSATITAMSSAVCSITAVLNVVGFIPTALDDQIVYASSLLIATPFVVMMVSIHHTVPERRRIWTHTALAFAHLYAVLVSIVYMTHLFVTSPSGLGDLGAAAAHETFLHVLDGFSYLFLGLSTLAAAWVFTERGVEQWIRRLFILNEIVTLPVILACIVDPVWTVLGSSGLLRFPSQLYSSQYTSI